MVGMPVGSKEELKEAVEKVLAATEIASQGKCKSGREHNWEQKGYEAKEMSFVCKNCGASFTVPLEPKTKER